MSGSVPSDVSQMSTSFSDAITALNSEMLKIDLPKIGLGSVMPEISGTQFADLVANLTRALDHNSFRDIAASLESGMASITPANLNPVSIETQFEAVTSSVRWHFSVADAVPSAVVEDLARQVEDEDRTHQVLMDHRTSICEVSAASLHRLSGSSREHGHHADLALRAVDAFNAGHDQAAQALATAVWDSHLTGTVEGGKFVTELKKRGAGRPDWQDSLNAFYMKAAWGPAVSSYGANPKSPGRYSRNATVHEASDSQYREVNALCAITIATGVLAHTER